MKFILLQIRYNIKILLDNIAKKYNLDKKKLIELYLPERINKNIKICIDNYKNKYYNLNSSLNSNLLNKNLLNKNLLNKNLNANDKLKYKIFTDKDGNLYYLINKLPLKYNGVYDSIKLK